ncbi:hypothetical protein ACFL21_02505 [Patescibacteria group bacterium]
MIEPNKEEKQQLAVFQDKKTQKDLNKPLEDPTGISEEDQNFLELIIELIDEGKIDLYKPASLFNHEVYDKLDQEKQGKADLEAVNILSAIRDIHGLYKNDMKETFQMQNLVHRLRETKERIEAEGGDLFII